MSTTRTRLFVVAFTIAMLSVIPGTAWGQLTVTDDTYVSGAAPTTANGSVGSLVVQGSTTGKPSYSYIRFDLTSLGAVSGAQVQKATLRLYVSAVTVAGGFDVIELTSPAGWVEGTLIYNTPSASSPSGTMLNVSPISVPYPSGKYQYILVDVTPAVQHWLNGTQNNGLVLKPHDTSISVAFASKEDTTYSHDPALNVVMSLTNGTVTSIGTGAGLTGGPITSSGTIALLPATGLTLGGVKAPFCASGSHFSGIAVDGTLSCTADSTASSLSFSAITGGINSGQGLLVGNGSSLAPTGTGTITATSAATALNVTGIVGVPNGGTGASTAAAGRANLLAAASGANSDIASMAALNSVSSAVSFTNPASTFAGNAATATSATTAGSAATAGFATNAGNATTANTANSATDASKLGGIVAANYARLDLANIFAGKQTLAPSTAGYSSLNVPNSTNAPTTPAIGDVWLINLDPHLQFRDKNNATQSLAFLSDFTGGNNTYTGNNSFSGNNSFTGSNTFAGITASSLSASGNVSANSFSGPLTGNVTGNLTGNVLGNVTGNLFGNADTATLAGTATNALNLGGLAPSAYAVLGAASNTFTGSVSAASFSGVGTNLTSLNASNLASGTVNDTVLSTNVALITRANLFGAGKKQTFTANDNSVLNGMAGLNLAGVTSNPQSLAQGDVWFRTDTNHLQFQDASNATQSLAFLSDFTGGNNTYTGNNSFSGNNSFTGSNTFAGITASSLSASGNVSANSFSGPLTGNVTGSLTGNVLGNVTGNLFGNADTATLAGTATNALNLGGLAPSAYAVLGAASNTFTGSVSAASFSGVGTNLTSLNASNLASGTVNDTVLSTNVALITRANLFGAGKKQTFTANDNSVLNGMAGLNLAGVTSNPQSLAQGDVWFRTDTNHLQFQDASNATQSLAFLSDFTGGNNTYTGNNSFSGNNSFTGSNTFAGITASSLSASGNVSANSFSGPLTGNVTGNLTGNVLGNVTGNLFGNADTATLAGTATNALNLGGLAPSAYAVLGAASNTFTGSVSAASFSGVGTNLTSLNASNLASGTVNDTVLSTNVALITRANLFGAGKKQTFTANDNSVLNGMAGLNLAGVTSNPQSLTQGDVWFRTDTDHLQFQDASNATQSLAFLSDFTGGNNTYTGNNSFSGANTFSNAGNLFTGSGAGLTALNAGNLASGIVPSARLTGSYAIDVSGNAATATTAAFATGAGSAASVPFSGVAAGTNTAALTVGPGGSLITSGTGSIDATQLGGVPAATYVRTDQANIYGAGNKQTFVADATPTTGKAGLNVAGITGDPAMLASGDLWFDLGLDHLRFRDNSSASHTLMFQDDTIQNNQLQNNSITVSAGNPGISVSGSPVALGGTVSVSNAGVLSNIAGTGISVSSATGNVIIANSGVTSFNSSTGAVTGVSSVTAGNAGILIGGTAANPTIANAGVLSFNGNVGNILAVFPANTTAVTHQFFTSYNALTGVFTQAQPSLADLTGTDSATSHLVYNNQANAFTGGKQTLAPSATGFASLNFPNSGVTPTTPAPAIGDLWLTTGDPHLQFQSAAGTTKSLAFTTDVGGGTVGGDLSGTVSNATVAKVNGVSYGPTPSTNTVPVVTASNTVTYEQVPNAALANSSTSVNGQTCTLGGSCTVTAVPSGSAGGDLSSNYPGPTVAKINGSPLGTTTGASSGQVLAWNGTQWAAASVTGGGFASQTKNTVFAAPDGTNGTPSFRAIAANDLPAATSSAFGAVRPTIVNAVTNGVNLKNATVTFAVNCAAGRFVLGGGVNTDVTTQVMVMASYPSAAGTWTATLQGMNNNAANSVQVTVYAVCSGN